MTALSPLIESFDYLLKASLTTLMLTIAAAVPATLLGVGFAVAHTYGDRWVRTALAAYLFFARGVPLLVLIVFVYYMLPRFGVNLPAFWAVTLVLALYFAAFIGEVLRAGLDALPRAQWDAAASLGMPRALLLRTVILPQALRLAAPPYVNLCVSLIKATSLASVVGLWELTLASLEVVERTLAPFQVFAGAALIYFCFCYSLSLYGQHLERRLIAGH
jgi:His/Glu/Gln/Arg/opine family amino acid ABC transporter permease subunit